MSCPTSTLNDPLAIVDDLTEELEILQVSPSFTPLGAGFGFYGLDAFDFDEADLEGEGG